MRSLGIDIGSSSVKVSLLDITSGQCVASATNPKKEMKIDVPQSGWAEQDPAMWWNYVCEGIKEVCANNDPSEIKSIGITYQMHGLVMLDTQGSVLRKSIIWCDSRAVPVGVKAFEDLGADYCLEHLLNSPGNFTASKLAWVKQNEPDVFAQAAHVLLPGDYIAYLLSGNISTTVSGLSEQILWDFKQNKLATELLDYYGISEKLYPQTHASVGVISQTNKETEALFGIPQGTPISYCAGDQPNNAFSLNVMEAGEIAATGGTSGVVYGVTQKLQCDRKSRVNPFAHINYTTENPKYGILLCINGTGILNSWAKQMFASELSYEAINELALTAPIACDGLSILPFGNGAERVLENNYPGTTIGGIDLNRHTKAHILRAVQEGIAFAFKYGIEIMREMGLNPSVIRAGKANMFLSPLFCQTLSTITGSRIELFNTDGAMGAARGAALGAGYYKDRNEAFESLKLQEVIEPKQEDISKLNEAYNRWVDLLTNNLNKTTNN